MSFELKFENDTLLEAFSHIKSLKTLEKLQLTV